MDFKNIDVEIPFSSLLSKNRLIDITLKEPNISLPEELLKPGRSTTKSNLPFKINNVNVEKGRFEFKGKKIYINLLEFNLNSYSLNEKTFYKLSSEHLRIDFPVGKKIVSMEGKISGEFIRSAKKIRIKSVLWETKDIMFTGNGYIEQDGNIALRMFWEGTPKNILYPILKKLTIDGYLTGNINFIRNREKEIVITGKFDASQFSTGGEEFRALSGTIRWNNRSKKIRSSLNFGSNRIRTSISLDSKKKITNIHLNNISAEKVFRAIKVMKDVPLGGVVKSAELKINGRDLQGDFFVERGEEVSPLFNVEGKISLKYNTGSKNVIFSSDKLLTEFGTITSLQGKSIPQEKLLDIRLVSGCSSLEGINVYTKKYASLDLSDWNFKNGIGILNVRFKKNSDQSNLYAKFNLKNLLSNNVNISVFNGIISGKNSVISGDLDADSENVSGKIKLTRNSSGLDIKINDLSGESDDLLKILDIGLDLRGRVTGNFRYQRSNEMKYPLVTGIFSAEKIIFYDFPFSELKGRLKILNDTEIENLTFRYHKGVGSANIVMNTSKKSYSVSGKIEQFDVSEFISGLSGKGSFYFNGSGKFYKNPIKIRFNFNDVSLYKGRTMSANGTASINTDFSSFELRSAGLIRYGLIKSPAYLNLSYGNSLYNGEFGINIGDINMIMPWVNNSGTVTVNGEILSGNDGNIQYRGLAEASGIYLSFPGFPHTLDNFRGSILFNGTDFSLRSLSGSIGGGNVTGNGKLLIEGDSIKKMNFNLSGRNMELYPMDRTGFSLDADLGLKKRGDKYLIDGDLKFQSAIWEREIDEGVSFYTGNSLTAKNSKFLDNLEFDIHMSGDRNINVNNSFFTGNCKVDLRLTGDKNFPVLFGSIDSKKGLVHVSSRDFDLIKAKIIFNNPVVINPDVNIDAETFIKNYRIRFLLNGPSSDLRPEFLSSPPIPTQDIIALMSLGELFKRPVSTNISSEVGTTGLITSALTEKIQDRVKKLLGIDILKLDPDPTRSSLEGTSRLTIGKSITKDFLIVYSTDISRTTRDVYFFQYRITPSILLIGKRNEDGRLSLDVRFRKRY